jgi:hypothetical protein
MARKKREWERPAIFAFGVAFVIVLLILAMFFPSPTDFQYFVFRTVLALAAAGVAALIPGLLDIDMPLIRAGGALAVLILVYKFTPASLVITKPPPSETVVVVKICAGEYERNCQPHDVYQYCDVLPDNWAKPHCSSYTVQRLDTRDGNKCGYTLDQVICKGPR